MKHPIIRALACALLGCPLVAAAESASSRYLFVWAMETRNYHEGMPMLENQAPHLAAWRRERDIGKDFLAVFDVRPGPTFGQLVTTLTAGDAAMAHHTNYEMPSDHVLYANDWLGNHTYVFDLHDAAHPRLVRDFRSVGAYSYPHSFAHLASGETLATFQYSGGYNAAPGGLVKFDSKGRVVQKASAAAAVDPNIRPYSLAVVEPLDRVVTGSADMMGAQVSHVVQIWRLSDLKLLETLPLPAAPDWTYDTAADSSEPRVLADGRTVIVSTFNCGLFLLENLAGKAPTLRHVYDFGYRTCEVPVIAGRFLVETMQSGHAVVSVDLRDPGHPREVSRLLFAPDEYPHWLGLEPGGERLAITGYGALATHLRFARIDRGSGQLSLEPSSIDFTRAWPDGWHGAAVPHGVVFDRP